MAKAKKCDRCGNYYDRNLFRTEKGGTVRGIDVISANGTIRTCFDLCDKCLCALSCFLENPKFTRKEE